MAVWLGLAGHHSHVMENASSAVWTVIGTVREAAKEGGLGSMKPTHTGCDRWLVAETVQLLRLCTAYTQRRS